MNERAKHTRRILEAYRKDRPEGEGRSQGGDVNERTKHFLIKFVVVIAVLVGLYYIFSPYENCMRWAEKVGVGNHYSMLSACENTNW